MKRLIQTQLLYDNYYDLVFGYEAVDIDTGKRYYFSFYNEGDKWDFKLHPFDPKNPSNKISWHLHHCDFSFDRFSNDIHPELAEKIEEVIINHQKYNEEKGYPTTILNFNKENLKVIYNSCDSLFNDEKILGFYIPIENQIELSYSKYHIEKNNVKEKNRFISTIIHEVGHIKVSGGKVVDNKLLVKTGFYPNEVFLKPINLFNGDIFYEIPESPNSRFNLEKKALEEIINDTDCALLFPTFERNYPNIGDSLNKLCDGILPKLRYEEDAFALYCDYLKKITESQDTVDEMNGLIKDAIYGRNARNDKLKVLKLIRKCQDRKNCKN